MIRTLPLLWLTVHVACAAQTRLAEPIRNAVAARHAGRTVELRLSCYYGDLYDENEKWLLSPHPFAETHHIVDTDGAPIHPRNQRGIVPAGSRFVVKRVEFPDLHAMSMRMLTTPRYNPWIYLSPAPGSGELPTGRTTFVLLLPMDQETEAEVEASINELLADEGAVTAWLATRTPTIQVAIKHKQMIAGMEEVDLLAAMGKPPRWFADQLEGKSTQVAWYPSQEAWLIDAKVAKVAPARAVAPAQPSPADSAPTPKTTAPPRSEETTNVTPPATGK